MSHSSGFCLFAFFIIPFLAPRLVPSLRTNEALLTTNRMVEVTVRREATPSDIAARNANIAAWDKAMKEIGLETPRSRIAHNMEQAYAALRG